MNERKSSIIELKGQESEEGKKILNSLHSLNVLLDDFRSQTKPNWMESAWNFFQVNSLLNAKRKVLKLQFDAVDKSIGNLLILIQSNQKNFFIEDAIKINEFLDHILTTLNLIKDDFLKREANSGINADASNYVQSEFIDKVKLIQQTVARKDYSPPKMAT